MTMKRILLLSMSTLIAQASFATNQQTLLQSQKPKTATTGCIKNQPATAADYSSVKWYRDSAERKAQYSQTFNFGLEKVKAKVEKDKLEPQTWGVILDIDETVLDNSLYEKENVLSCDSYTPASNYAFMERAVSTATPGAIKFTCGVQELGGKVVLVTNRDGTYDKKIQPATIYNLKKAGICFDNVVFAAGPNDENKTPRFNAVIKGDYDKIIAQTTLPALNIVAYFGDNIQDFPNSVQQAVFAKPTSDEFYQHFGQDYFSLPNPMYGSWTKNSFK